MERVSITDHAERATGRLPSYLKDAENTNAIAEIIGDRAQLLEVDNDALFSGRGLSGAEGLQLDNLGGILGEARNERSDTDYLNALETRILINTSFGTTERIQQVAARFANAVDVQVDENYPASLLLRIVSPAGFDELALLQALNDAKPLGVRLLAVEQLDPVIPDGSDLDDPADYADPSDPLEVGIRLPFGTRLSTDPATSLTRGGYAALVSQGTTGETPAGAGLTNIFNDAGATFMSDGVLADYMLNVHGVGIFQVVSTPTIETQLILKNATISEGLSNLSYHIVSPVRAGIYARII